MEVSYGFLISENTRFWRPYLWGRDENGAVFPENPIGNLVFSEIADLLNEFVGCRIRPSRGRIQKIRLLSVGTDGEDQKKNNDYRSRPEGSHR